MKNIISVLFLLIVTQASSLASQNKFEILIHNYMDSFLDNDEKKLQTLVSKQYYKDLKKDKTLEYIYAQYKKKKPDKTKRAIDVQVKKGLIDKDYFYVNVKDASDPNYGKTWFVVTEDKSNKLIIDSVVDFEEGEN